MRNQIGLVLVMISLFVMIGCNNDQSTHKGMNMGNEESFMPIMVELSIQAEQVKVNDKVMIEVLVTQNNKNVTDANKVLIEFVPSTEGGKHVELEAAHAGEGKYVLETSLDQADTYNVISHVTVGAMHSMPKKELVVTE
ncbi:FixH family protein [Paenibacillus sp. FA6]|uniref:FixH family protein n=1 Tax=Paenibacillus sp. FA6 TaxID=3413029 RepID=UPI003F65B309